MANEKMKKDFYEKYPVEKYGSTALKLYLNDFYRMELTEEDLDFLRDLNAIGDEDFELKALIESEYLRKGTEQFIEATGKEFDIEVSEYFGHDAKRLRESNSVDDGFER